jgi:hypothetical protein
LLFLNPDTRLVPDTLETVTNFTESDAGAGIGIGIGGVEVVDADGEPMTSAVWFTRSW